MSPNEENLPHLIFCVNHTYSEPHLGSLRIKAHSIENKTHYVSRGQVARVSKLKKLYPFSEESLDKENAMQHCASNNGIP
jgi:hypothetical protein